MPKTIEELLWESAEYKINKRRFGKLKKDLFKGDYIGLKFPYKEDFVVYMGAEYQQLPKLPNLTVLPNLQTIAREIILGSTMGHQHINKKEQDTRLFQEIYEFHGYGIMLLRNNKKTDLHVLKPGQKVLISPKDAMTLYNLDSTPLNTLDYANPEINDANKDLEKTIGPLILIRFNNNSASFHINNSYIKRELINSQTNAPIQIDNTELGEDLYHKIAEHSKEFEKKGIKIVKGGDMPLELEKEFKPSLLKLALAQNKTLLKKLGFN